MTRGRGFKRLVRQRMGKTGESYTSARAHLFPSPPGSRASTTGGDRTVYPFERLTGRAKHALALAELEAERSGHSYIGTEHLVLGLLLEAGGLAGRVLAGMGVETGAVRESIASILQGGRPIPVQERVPTSRVRRVIEIAFGEAQVMGHRYVGTEHLLLGLLVEGQGIGARVLIDRGVTLDEVRSRIARELAPTGRQMASRALRRFPSGAPARVPLSAELVALLEDAQSLAEKEGAEAVRVDHLGVAVFRRARSVRGLAALLAACGADLDLVRHRLRVPAAVPRLQAALVAAKRERVEAVGRGDTEGAAAARERDADLRRKLVQALDAWQSGWAEAP